MSQITFGGPDVVQFLSDLKPDFDAKFDAADAKAATDAQAALDEADAKHKEVLAKADDILEARKSEIEAARLAALASTDFARQTFAAKHAAALQAIATQAPVTVTLPDPIAAPAV